MIRGCLGVEEGGVDGEGGVSRGSEVPRVIQSCGWVGQGARDPFLTPGVGHTHTPPAVSCVVYSSVSGLL